MNERIRTEDAINHFGGRGKGGVQKLADALGITHGAVSQWGEYVPPLQAYRLQEMTKGQLVADASAAESTVAPSSKSKH